MVTHLVLFKFERMQDAEEAVDRLRSMRNRIPGLLEIEAGVDFTRSARSFEVGLLTRHTSRADLEAYQVDPLHQEVAAFIRAHSSGAAAVDFET
ncbi:MAG TPA: Dabb family protein [Polyangiaceae bacterium]|nr:Dabb family protein [Polyangiaceae bacterium]